MSHYSNITNGTDEPKQTSWNNIVLSPRTQKERRRIKWGIDQFASFTWRGIDAFETFGAFIINNKNSLKFYNGPTFTNEYTKPQFETAAGQLTGVTFAIQKIDFMVGVYWISEEDYRQFIYWLHPYVIDTLTFGFEPNYYYQVKLASIDNGNRYIVGYEDNVPMYYTEMKVTFEIQGPAVAYGPEYLWHEPEIDVTADNIYQSTQTIKVEDENFIATSLDTSFSLKGAIDLRSISPLSGSLLYSAFVIYDDNEEDAIKLFEIEFKNLSYYSNLDSAVLNIVYDSEKALVFVEKGDGMRELLTRLTTVSSGDRMIDHLQANQFYLSGLFNDPDIDLSKIKIKYNITIEDGAARITDKSTFFRPIITCRPRTNLI